IPQALRYLSLSCHRNQTSSSDDNKTTMPFLRKLKEYPELYEMHRASRYRATKEFWARMRAEPELFRLYQQDHSRRMERLYAQAEYRVLNNQRSLADYYAHKHDERFARIRSVHYWSFRLPNNAWSVWVRECLPWKTHRPVKYLAKTECYCACCGIPRQLKAVWQSTTDPSVLMCNKHYAERGWPEAMPKGYEDIRTFGDLRARYDELNGSMASRFAYDKIKQRSSETSPSSKTS
ncbi:unnamed protein product, partial [Aureobasidium vineae]